MTMIQIPEVVHRVTVRITRECQLAAARKGCAVPREISYKLDPSQFARALALGGAIDDEGCVYLNAHEVRLGGGVADIFTPSSFNAKEAHEFTKKSFEKEKEHRLLFRITAPMSRYDLMMRWPQLGHFSLETVPAHATEALEMLEALAARIAAVREEIASSCSHLASSEEQGPHLSVEPCLRCGLHFFDEED